MLTCETCGGTRRLQLNPEWLIDGKSPDGTPIDVPCFACTEKWDELAAIGARWRKDSSLEKWFPFTAQELTDLRKALADVMSLIDEQWLVRNADRDAEPGFAMRQLEPMMKLARAHALLNKSPVSEPAAQ